MTEKEIYYEVLTKNGAPVQVMLLFEKLGELMKSIAEYDRQPIENKEKDEFAITKKIADVEIMLGQLKEIFDISDRVAIEKDRKLKIIEKRVKRKNYNEFE